MIENAFIPVFNHLLAAAPWARERLQPHAGLVARLDVAPVSIGFSVDTHGLLQADAAETPDVVLSIPLTAVPQFALGRYDEAMRAVHLQGNAEFADALGFVFRNLRWDAEEDLARVVGDVAAHRIAAGARALGEVPRQIADKAGANLAEYLTEERALLVAHPAAKGFDDDLRTLRDALARLAKRIERLEGGHTGKR
ncbi:ubiquinone biosynthesis accessory factor UbiJ [Pseudothauera rhizosphaerae]|uniref:Ubiquinone biosynthesis accessory factor UbiJ n=1 Tax=Pseudothauera rhizosphaerae TaxID=2565932 RepID=A0A4S4AKZ4_9RHOO|nr:SCP2 sterol-binding domain-containing protein [Pseudothauera rhizosphaerae]THF60165.1 hypothetical protein E6O51_14655 [Pseudothauera rhizosphaerae]